MQDFTPIKDDILGKDYILSLAFVSSKKSQEVNRTYRKKDRPTNVLSFAFDKKNGELLLCKPVIREEAKKLGKTFDAWLTFLVIHGLLHLKGMDHSATMERAEKKYSAQYIYFDDQEHNSGNRHRILHNASRGRRISKGRQKS